jgi:hypothetical protein
MLPSLWRAVSTDPGATGEDWRDRQDLSLRFDALGHRRLQRLVNPGFKVAIAAAFWISGLLLLFYTSWNRAAPGQFRFLQPIAWIREAAVFALLIFPAAHLDRAATMGYPCYSWRRSTATGYEEIEEPK